VKKRDIREQGLVGTLYSGEGKRPGIVLLSGSDGGIPGANSTPEAFIEFLVKKGFTVFALGYFGVPGLPENLEKIPLEYFKKAMEWFQPHVQDVRLIGQSRGGELVLLLGVFFPELIHSIVAIVPCSMVCGGLPHTNWPAWTYENKPVEPFLTALTSSEKDATEFDDLKVAYETGMVPYHANTAEDPYQIEDLFRLRIKKSDAGRAAIPVEKIRCPLLLLSGSLDAIWPAEVFCEQIMKRLEGSSIVRKHINYVDAGHGLIAAYDGAIFHPVGQFWCRLGGTVEGNKMANERSWNDIAQFFEEIKQKN
jgi:fermentation-respiration switch protein FrsA (DUF1100 family)